MYRKSILVLSAAVIAASSFAISVSSAAEFKVRAVGPWPKTHPLIKSFNAFIDKSNKAGKGILKITYIGGPEITKPREQANAMRNGLFDMLYGPPSYFLGAFPEADFAHGFKTAMQQRASGAYAMVQQAMKQKMNARFIARFDSGLGLYLFLKDKPKMTAAGLPDLTGLKLRASPTYRDLIKDLGGTAVVMSPQKVYTALERGVIDGMGYSLSDIRARGVQKFVNYRIDPPFSHATIAISMNHDVWDKMPQKARDFLNKQAAAWEEKSYHHWKNDAKKEHKALAKLGMKTIALTGKPGRDYVSLFLKGRWERMEKNKKIKIDVKKLKMLSY